MAVELLEPAENFDRHGKFMVHNKAKLFSFKCARHADSYGAAVEGVVADFRLREAESLNCLAKLSSELAIEHVCGLMS